MKKTRENCERKSCFVYGVKGDNESKIRCYWDGKEICKEEFFEKCKTKHTRCVFGSHCKRKRCCKYSKNGDKIKKLECKNVGEEVCSVSVFKKM